MGDEEHRRVAGANQVADAARDVGAERDVRAVRERLVAGFGQRGRDPVELSMARPEGQCATRSSAPSITSETRSCPTIRELGRFCSGL
jgi:hypothetical protein